MVLPFAVAERDFGPFAALRSQNYSNFLGREGVTFQDIDQSPFQKTCFFGWILHNFVPCSNKGSEMICLVFKQESGASSLLPYAEGFLDHRWEGSQAQYQNFRERLGYVPTL